MGKGTITVLILLVIVGAFFLFVREINIQYRRGTNDKSETTEDKYHLEWYTELRGYKNITWLFENISVYEFYVKVTNVGTEDVGIYFWVDFTAQTSSGRILEPHSASIVNSAAIKTNTYTDGTIYLECEETDPLIKIYYTNEFPNLYNLSREWSIPS